MPKRSKPKRDEALELRRQIAEDLNSAESSLSMAEPGYDSYGGEPTWGMSSIQRAIQDVANAVGKLAGLKQIEPYGWSKEKKWIASEEDAEQYAEEEEEDE